MQLSFLPMTEEYAREIVAWPQVVDGLAQRDLKYRFNWNAPIILSRHEPGTVFHASQRLLRSRDEGQTWEEASPDLSRNDTTKQGYSGGPISHEITGVETYGTIFYVVESPHEARTIWAGTDDGLVHITRNNGTTWENVTPKGIPEWIRINAIDVSPHDRATAYVAATMYQFDDYRPYLYKTGDYGKTWTKIVSGIPDTAFTRDVREDPGRQGRTFAFLSLTGLPGCGALTNPLLKRWANAFRPSGAQGDGDLRSSARYQLRRREPRDFPI